MSEASQHIIAEVSENEVEEFIALGVGDLIHRRTVYSHSYTLASSIQPSLDGKRYMCDEKAECIRNPFPRLNLYLYVSALDEFSCHSSIPLPVILFTDEEKGRWKRKTGIKARISSFYFFYF